MCHFLGPDSIIHFFSAGKSLKDNYSARETYDMIFFLIGQDMLILEKFPSSI